MKNRTEEIAAQLAEEIEMLPHNGRCRRFVIESEVTDAHCDCARGRALALVEALSDA